MIKILLLSPFLILFSCNNSIDDAVVENNIKGLYKLHIIESKDSVENWNEANWMKNGKGLLHYDYYNVSVHFTPENYGESDSIKAYWYVANYSLNEDSNFVEHTRIMHSDPEEEGETVRRYFKIKKDTLVMHAKEFGLRLKWLKQ